MSSPIGTERRPFSVRREVTAHYHPHIKWNEKKPPHLSFVSECAVQKL